MSVTIENLPIVFLVLIGIGMIIVLVGVLRLAYEQETSTIYTNLEENDPMGHLEDLFGFFLQEEEKKNQSFRQMIMDVTKSSAKGKVVQSEQVAERIENIEKKKTIYQGEQSIYKEIIKRYEMGQNVEMIAKELKKGTGEVKLIISLYARR